MDEGGDGCVFEEDDVIVDFYVHCAWLADVPAVGVVGIVAFGMVGDCVAWGVGDEGAEIG